MNNILKKHKKMLISSIDSRKWGKLIQYLQKTDWKYRTHSLHSWPTLYEKKNTGKSLSARWGASKRAEGDDAHEMVFVNRRTPGVALEKGGGGGWMSGSDAQGGRGEVRTGVKREREIGKEWGVGEEQTGMEWDRQMSIEREREGGTDREGGKKIDKKINCWC